MAVYRFPAPVAHGCIPITMKHGRLPVLKAKSAIEQYRTVIGGETIHAVREIAQGEETTLSYCHTGHSKISTSAPPKQFQLSVVPAVFAVSQHPSACLATTDRRRRSNILTTSLVTNGAHLTLYPQQHLQKVHTLIRLLEAEQISDARLPRAHYDAFQTVIAHGDQARAKVFAERAYAARLGYEGEDSPGTLQMRLLAENPQSHGLFGTSKRWRQNKRAIPKGLEELLTHLLSRVWRKLVGFTQRPSP